MARNLTQQLQFINRIIAYVDPYTGVSITPTLITIKSVHKEGSAEFHIEAAAIKQAIEFSDNYGVIHEPAK